MAAKDQDKPKIGPVMGRGERWARREAFWGRLEGILAECDAQAGPAQNLAATERDTA